MMVLGITYLSSSWFENTSPFYVSEKSYEICPKYWWRNLLYINNLFGLKELVQIDLIKLKILLEDA